MIVIKSFVVLAIAVAVAVQAQAQNSPHGIGRRMHKRNNPTIKKRVADTVARLERRNPQFDLFPGISTASPYVHLMSKYRNFLLITVSGL
jgi:hypothetical protein